MGSIKSGRGFWRRSSSSDSSTASPRIALVRFVVLQLAVFVWELRSSSLFPSKASFSSSDPSFLLLGCKEREHDSKCVQKIFVRKDGLPLAGPLVTFSWRWLWRGILGGRDPLLDLRGIVPDLFLLPFSECAFRGLWRGCFLNGVVLVLVLVLILFVFIFTLIVTVLLVGGGLGLGSGLSLEGPSCPLSRRHPIFLSSKKVVRVALGVNRVIWILDFASFNQLTVKVRALPEGNGLSKKFFFEKKEAKKGTW